MSSFENFVQCRIVTPLAASATDVALYAAVAPYRLPPEAGGVLVLTDSPGNPSVVEVVRYSQRAGLALYGLQRGQEGTTARDWTGPIFCYQALMAGDFQSILDELNAGIDSKIDKAAGQSLMTDAERTKLSGIAAGAQVNTVTSVAGKTGAVALAKGDVGLGNVDNTSDAAKPVSTAQQTAFNLKANLASPTFTGIPKAPTPAATDNTTQLATTAFVQAVVAALVNGAPGALNELNELAAAMGNDPNFATTMLNALALKAPLDSPALTGNPSAPTPAADDSDTSIATTAFVRVAMTLFGIGAGSPTASNDANAIVAGGLYSLPAGTPADFLNFPAGAEPSRGRLVVVTADGNYGFQLFADRVNNDVWFRNNSGGWKPWVKVWHTGNLVKQTHNADTTVGALMAVGAFGLGAADSSIMEADNVWKGSRIRGWSSTAAASPASGTEAVGLDLGYTPGRRFQMAVSRYNDLLFRYTADPAVGGDWRRVFNDRNILGAVSQSGGVPTGAAFQAISNTNGFCLRMLDGTQICWLGNAPAEAGLRITNVSAGATGTVVWEFPAAFIAPPHMTADWGSIDGSIRVNGQPQRLANRSTTQCPINWRALLDVGGAAVQLDAMAIGRWYN